MLTLLIGALAASLSFLDVVAPSVASQDATDQARKSFTVQKGGLLDVDVEPGSINLTTWDKNEVLVEAENIDERRPEKLTMTQSGNNVRVQYRDRRRRDSDIRFNITVPSQFNAKLKTSGGSVKQEGNLTGNFETTSGGGSIEIEHVIGEVEIETGGGSVRIEKADGNASIQTGGGSVDVRFVRDELTLRTGGGSVKVSEVGKKLKLDTGGGSIRIGDIQAEAEVRTGGGSVDIGKVKSRLTVTTGGGSVEVKGAGDDAKIKTGGGSIEMADAHGNIELTTGGGSIRAELASKGSGTSRLQSGGGDVTLYLSSSSKAEIDAHVERSWGHGSKKIDIRSDFPSQQFDKGEDEITASYLLNGGGEKITIETSNGVIEIRKLK